MRIADFISPGCVAIRLQATSKKRAIELVSGLIAEASPTLAQTGLVDSLISRERLGSTGIGHGIAIPQGG